MEQKIEKFSPTMIADYISCPRSFYYKYIAKIEMPQKQIHLLFGGGIHKGIEEMYENKDPYSAFEKHFDKSKLLPEERDLHKDHLSLGNEMLKNYFDSHDTLDKLYSLKEGKSEVYLRRYLINPLTGEKTSRPMTGRIDRLTKKGKIVEYKTAKNKWCPTDMNFKIQTFLYNLWFFSEYGELADEILYIILLKKFKEKTRNGEVIQVLNQKCTKTDLAMIFYEIEIILEKIDRGEFDYPSGYHPAYCDCHLYEKMLNIR